MHDLAQNFTSQHLLEIAAPVLELDGFDETNPHLLQAQVSPRVARDRFALQDREILPEMENHSLGRPGMSRISSMLVVADSIIDLGRGNTSELDELQVVSRENLAQAVWLSWRLGAETLDDYQSFNSPANDIDQVLVNANGKPQPTISPG